MPEDVTMALTAKELGVTIQTLAYYRKRGLLTHHTSGRIILMDPEKIKEELDALGYFEPQREEARAYRRALHRKTQEDHT